MLKKITKAFTIICLLLLIGCSKEDNNKNTDSQYKYLLDNLPKVERKYYDESRLEKNKNYTFDEAVSKFSFIIYEDYWERDMPENKQFIYSFAETDSVKLFNGSLNEYEFRYNTDDISSTDVTIRYTDYTKANYKEKLKEDNYEITKEEDGIVHYNSSSSEYSFNAFKCYSEEACLSASVSIYSSTIQDKQAKAIKIIKEVFDTITLDNKEPILQDKVATIKNYDGKTLISAEYISPIDVYETSIGITYNDLSLTIDFNEENYHIDGPWTILSNNPYTLINENKTYKIVKNGLPEYYAFTQYDKTNYENKPMGGTLEDFNILISLFYK